jgi:hypothetical protein
MESKVGAFYVGVGEAEYPYEPLEKSSQYPSNLG